MSSLGSKFAHLWMCPEGSSESGGSGTEDESLQSGIELNKNMDQEPIEYLRDISQVYEPPDLFTSFGFESSFGTLGQQDVSPIGLNNTNAADRTYSPNSSWQSENVCVGNLYHRSSSGSKTIIDFDDLCHNNFNGVQTNGEMGTYSSKTNGTEGHVSRYDPNCVGSLTGLDGPQLLSSSPISFSPDTEQHFQGPLASTPEEGFEYMDIIVDQITAALAENTAEYSHATTSGSDSRGPWANSTRLPTFGNITLLTMQKWVKLLRRIQDNLSSAADMETCRRVELCDMTCNLQKQLLHQIMGIDIAKLSYAVPGTEMNMRSLQQAARYHRETGGSLGLTHTPIIWRGVLPRRNYQNAMFSCKVFLGGLPYDMTETGMIQAFKLFGNVKVEWPGKEMNPLQHKGYAYVIFETEKQVKVMLQNCTRDFTHDGKWFCKMSSRKVRMKDVEVIPWALSDTNYSLRPVSKLDPGLTIFVGALHGMLNAEGLAKVMDDVYGGVVHAGIDTDRNKYPIGSGRITFNNFESYFNAINGAYVEIKSSKFSKVVQLDPYLEDSTCSLCHLQQAPYFCRDLDCFRYFCRTCFDNAHAKDHLRSHRPLMRNPNRKAMGATTLGLSSPNGCTTYNTSLNGNSINSGLNFTFSPNSGRNHLSRMNMNFIPGSRFMR